MKKKYWHKKMQFRKRIVPQISFVDRTPLDIVIHDMGFFQLTKFPNKNINTPSDKHCVDMFFQPTDHFGGKNFSLSIMVSLETTYFSYYPLKSIEIETHNRNEILELIRIIGV